MGSSHTLTATLSPARNNVRIRFEVLSGPNDGLERSDTHELERRGASQLQQLEGGDRLDHRVGRPRR